MNAPIALLEVRELCLRFGGLTAVDHVSFAVHAGEIVSVIGPNGAGKTSLFNAITGVHPPTSGEILIDGRALSRRLDVPTMARWLGLGLLSALLLGLAVDVVGVWSASGVTRYVPPQAFNWHAALSHAVARLGATPWPLGGALLGLLLGISGAAVVWRRARQEPELAVRLGLARTFQNIRLFKELSVLDNVLVGMDARLHSGSLRAVVRSWGERREHRRALVHARELLEFVGLQQCASHAAGSLSYGHQRRLEIARALASQPRLVLLDEPAAGMNPREADELIGLIRRIKDRGVTVLLIEHHMRVVMGISDRIVVLHFGHTLATGTPQQVRMDQRVVEAYLGTESSSQP